MSWEFDSLNKRFAEPCCVAADYCVQFLIYDVGELS
jgi:hypothetical protein